MLYTLKHSGTEGVISVILCMTMHDHPLCSKQYFVNKSFEVIQPLYSFEFNCIYLKTYFNVILREVAKQCLPTELYFQRASYIFSFPSDVYCTGKFHYKQVANIYPTISVPVKYHNVLENFRKAAAVLALPPSLSRLKCKAPLRRRKISPIPESNESQPRHEQMLTLLV